MTDFGFIDERRAMAALEQANKVVASIFGRPVIPIRFVFLSLIRGRSNDSQVLGQCVRDNGEIEIQLLLRPNWQGVAIHELIHAYAPMYSEAKVKVATREAIVLLKRRYTT